MLQTDLKAAGIAFYSIQNARTRNRMVEDLLEHRHDNTYSLFWNSWNKECRRLDGIRNQVAHWHLSTTHSVRGGIAQPSKSALKRPTYWSARDWQPISAMGPNELRGFAEECHCIAHMLGLFFHYLTEDFHGYEPQTLHDIFQQPIPYPPPADSPLSPNHKAPENPAPPSQE